MNKKISLDLSTLKVTTFQTSVSPELDCPAESDDYAFSCMVQTECAGNCV